MESPPPYYSPVPKKSNTGLIVGLILGAVVLCCIVPIGVIGGLGFWGLKKAGGFVGCSITVSNAQKAVLAYAHAHDDTLPKSATWETDIKPFYAKEAKKTEDAQKMFSSGTPDGSLGCTNDGGGMTGLSFNKELSGKKLSDIKDPSDSVLIFEVPVAGSNLSAIYKPQPFAQSPKMFNKSRGWYIAHVQGSPMLITRNGQTNEININTESSSGSDKG